MYKDGMGVRQNYVHAHAWFNVASANGVEEATELRAGIEKKMTPAQLAEAQKLAAEYFEKYKTK